MNYQEFINEIVKLNYYESLTKSQKEFAFSFFHKGVGESPKESIESVILLDSFKYT